MRGGEVVAQMVLSRRSADEDMEVCVARRLRPAVAADL
jgi:hypothetical protein